MPVDIAFPLPKRSGGKTSENMEENPPRGISGAVRVFAFAESCSLSNSGNKAPPAVGDQDNVGGISVSPAFGSRSTGQKRGLSGAGNGLYFVRHET